MEDKYYYDNSELTDSDLNILQNEINSFVRRVPKIISSIPRYLKFSDSELGKVKTNSIEILCDGIILNGKYYTPPSKVTNTITTCGSDVYVIASVVNGSLQVKTSLTYTDDDLVLGGFHYGQNKTYTIKDYPLSSPTYYLGILEDSFWTPMFRPECEPIGMVYIGNSTWMDIYLNSFEWETNEFNVDIPKLYSKYNKTKATGLTSSIPTSPSGVTSSAGLNYFDVIAIIRPMDKKLLTYEEYFAMCNSMLKYTASYSIGIKTGIKDLTNGITKNLNNYGVTDLTDLTGIWSNEIGDNTESSYSWGSQTHTKFLTNTSYTESIYTLGEAKRLRLTLLGHLNQSISCSSSWSRNSYAYYRDESRGTRATSRLLLN